MEPMISIVIRYVRDAHTGSAMNEVHLVMYYDNPSVTDHIGDNKLLSHMMSTTDEVLLT